MLEKLFIPLTTAASSGVAVRSIVSIIGVVLTLLGIFGALSPEQIAALRTVVDDLTGQWPQIAAALGMLMTAIIEVYRIVTKSSSDKAAEAAKAIDANVPPSAPVEIKTPVGQPDIIIAPKE